MGETPYRDTYPELANECDADFKAREALSANPITKRYMEEA